MTQVNIKRVYDEPSEQDGYRVLVDRLWPRWHEAGIFEIRLLGKRGHSIQ